MSTGSEQFPIDQLPPGYGDDPGQGAPIFNTGVSGGTGGLGNDTNVPSVILPGDQGSGNGGFDLAKYLPGGSGTAAQLFTAAQAYKDYLDSKKYMELATKYAGQLNPFVGERAGYQTDLKKSWEDPTAFLNDPAHLKLQERQMGAISRKMQAGGFMGGGGEMTALADYLATSDNQYLMDQRKELARLAGADINGAASGSLIEAGIKGSVDASNNSLTNLGRALSPSTGTSGSTTNGGNNRTVTPAQITSAAQRGLTWNAGSGSFTPDLTSPYWKQFNFKTDAEMEVWAKKMADAENGVHQGNLSPSQEFDEHGARNPNYVPPGSSGPPEETGPPEPIGPPEPTPIVTEPPVSDGSEFYP